MLNARRTDEKYRGSYETSIMKRFTEFANSPHVGEDLERLFTLIAINCALRNGDAHLKNFGIVYDDVQGEQRSPRSMTSLPPPSTCQRTAALRRVLTNSQVERMMELVSTSIGAGITVRPSRDLFRKIPQGWQVESICTIRGRQPGRRC